MKTWIIPVSWSMQGEIEVTADTLEDAKDKALESDIFDTPGTGTYICESLEIATDDDDYIRDEYNNGQEDEQPEKPDHVLKARRDLIIMGFDEKDDVYPFENEYQDSSYHWFKPLTQEAIDALGEAYVPLESDAVPGEWYCLEEYDPGQYIWHSWRKRMERVNKIAFALGCH